MFVNNFVVRFPLSWWSIHQILYINSLFIYLRLCIITIVFIVRILTTEYACILSTEYIVYILSTKSNSSLNTILIYTYFGASLLQLSPTISGCGITLMHLFFSLIFTVYNWASKLKEFTRLHGFSMWVYTPRINFFKFRRKLITLHL